MLCFCALVSGTSGDFTVNHGTKFAPFSNISLSSVVIFWRSYEGWASKYFPISTGTSSYRPKVMLIWSPCSSAWATRLGFCLQTQRKIPEGKVDGPQEWWLWWLSIFILFCWRLIKSNYYMCVYIHLYMLLCWRVIRMCVDKFNRLMAYGCLWLCGQRHMMIHDVHMDN